MRFCLKHVLVFMFLLPWAVLLQAEQPPLTIQADAVAFRYDDRAAFVEVFYQISEETGRVTGQTNWTSRLELRVTRNDSFWTENRWEHVNPVQSLDLTRPAVHQLGRVYFLAPEGEYDIQIHVHDPGADLSGAIVVNKQIRPFPSETASVSEIEMASSIVYAQQDTSSHPFLKNGLKVTPHPSCAYGDLNPVLYYYAEIYHLNTIADKQAEVIVSVLNEQGTPVSEIPARKRALSGDQAALVEMGGIGLFALTGGTYRLSILLADPEGNEISRREKRFYIFRKKKDKAVSFLHDETLYLQSPFADMTPKEVVQILDYTRIVLSEQEKKMANALEEESAKKRYLFEYWIAKEKNPKLATFGAYFDFRSRVNEVNQDFRIMGKPGWKTDRGRVYLKYGPPDDVDRHASTSDTNPFEVWTYQSIEGGVKFIFADLSSYKDYTLVHSTKQGEVYNPEYQSIIQRGY